MGGECWKRDSVGRAMAAWIAATHSSRSTRDAKKNTGGGGGKSGGGGGRGVLSYSWVRIRMVIQLLSIAL